jgi:hypothetical protein
LVADHACGFQYVSKSTIAGLDLTMADPDLQCRRSSIGLPRNPPPNQQPHRRLLYGPDRPPRR